MRSFRIWLARFGLTFAMFAWLSKTAASSWKGRWLLPLSRAESAAFFLEPQPPIVGWVAGQKRRAMRALADFPLATLWRLSKQPFWAPFAVSVLC
jgi:hypothetical protein